MHLDNNTNPIEFQGHRSKVKVMWFFLCFSVCEAAPTCGQ